MNTQFYFLYAKTKIWFNISDVGPDYVDSSECGLGGGLGGDSGSGCGNGQGYGDGLCHDGDGFISGWGSGNGINTTG